MKALVTATVIVALALGALLGGVARESRSATPAAPAPVEAEALRAGFAPGDTQALIGRLQADVAARPSDSHPLALLGLAYAQRARETGDAAYVSRADRALRRAVKLEPKDFEALTGLGGVALTRHRFRDALALARRALAAAPTTAAPQGVLGDALLELGRYDAAFAAFDRMAALKPNTSSYARVSYARELRGDVAGAIDAMELALDAAAGRPEAYAWTCGGAREAALVGRPCGARRVLLPARARRPSRLRTCARRARAIRGGARDGSAVRSRSQRRAVEAVPLPGYVAQLGDLLAATGRTQEARRAVRRSSPRSRRSRRRTARGSTSSPRSIAQTAASASARRSSSPASPTSAGPRSPATTCSPGRSPATAAAARRAAGRSGRCGSARAMPRSSSTAG